MRFIIVFSLILLSFAGCNNPKRNIVAPAVEKSAGTGSNYSTIPGNVKEYLKTNLPGWTIPDTSDYVRSWWSFYERSYVPYFLTVDLNDDHVADYAFILKGQNLLRVVILLASGNKFIQWVSDDFKPSYKEKSIAFGLNIEPPAQIDCVVNNLASTLILRSNGVALMEMEQRLKIFYWNKIGVQTFRVK